MTTEKVAEYFVVAGLTDKSKPLEEGLTFSSTNLKLGDHRKDPITDICIIDKTLEENCPQGFTCIEQTPGGMTANLNHGSLTAHDMFICYKRGRDKPPLIDLGVYYESLETVRGGISIIETTPAGRSANVNNKSGMGSHPIFLTFRRASESAPQNSLVLTDICIIFTNKGERAPYAFCKIDKNLNKGLIGSNVFLCYKKSMRQVNSISYKASFIDRYPRKDVGSFPLPPSVPLFCLPMGATIECWSSKTKHPLPTFSSFVLTTETSDKVFGAVISFYENYSEEKLTEDQKYRLGLLRGDGLRLRDEKTIHTNKAICILSRWPMFSVFRDFLYYLYKMTVSPDAHAVPVERHIAYFLEKLPFPSSQRPRVQYQMSPFHLTILTRPQVTPIPISGASFLALLEDMGADNMMTLLMLALTEHKIVIHSLRRAEITRVAEALITLLFPFKWQCTYVPLCPLEMAYVMEAPCPFIVGVDSRYFDLYEPPADVACVNLDTNTITILDERKHISSKLLPRKPAKQLKSTLHKYAKELKECPREESLGAAGVIDPEIYRTEKHRHLELNIQEAVLKFMAVIMKGYRQFLRPITEAPSVGTTDPNSLFNIQEFLRSREKASTFFSMLIGTQMFASFIEDRSLTTIGGGELAAGRLSSLVFFDECIDRLTPDYENIRLIEADDSLKSEHTVMVMAPDETGLPPGAGYQYTIFPRLTDELFILDEPDEGSSSGGLQPPRTRRASDTFTFGRRTQQEVRVMQKMARMHNPDALLWARLLLSHTYGAWFACLPAFVIECRHKSAALRTAHDALYELEDVGCLPLPDETYYRMLLHLCFVYNKPALAVRVFQFVHKTGTQLSAITYGLYNKAVLEGTWPKSNRDGYMLWRKLRNVLLAVRKLRYSIRHLRLEAGPNDQVSTASAESGTSNHDNEDPTCHMDGVGQDTLRTPTRNGTNGQSDHGYNSMPKNEVRRGTPVQDPSNPSNSAALDETMMSQLRNSSTSIETTTDSVISSIEDSDVPKPASLERTLSNRSVQPPSTLDLPSRPEGDQEGGFQADLGMKSDDTLVNGDVGLGVERFICEGQSSPHRPRASPVSPLLHRKPGRSGSIVKLCDEDGGCSGDVPSFPHDTHVKVLCTGSNFLPSSCDEIQLVKQKNHLIQRVKFADLIGSQACHVIATLPNHILTPPALEISDCNGSTAFSQSAAHYRGSVAKGILTSPMLSPSPANDNVFPEKSNGDTSHNAPDITPVTEVPSSSATLCSSESPAIQEIASLLKDDAKFFSSLSDSDKSRYQELCWRPASVDPEKNEFNATRHGSLLLSSSHARMRSSSALFAGSGGISPLVGQKPFGGSHPNTPTNRTNFDNLTAEDFVAPRSPSRSFASARSMSGSILTNTSRSSSRHGVQNSPSRRSIKKVAGSNILMVQDGEVMLTSTPLRPLIEPDHDETKPGAQDGADDKRGIKKKSTRSKQEAKREDISHLSQDPLSPPPLGDNPFSSLVHEPVKSISNSNLSRHLVEEIEGHLEKDSLVRCSSDATGLNEQRQRYDSSKEKSSTMPGGRKLQRKASLPSASPPSPRKSKPPPLQRSLTCHEDITNQRSSAWFGSGSKFNSLLKATTVGMANKAKKVASNLAKDLNETMQASLAYYTPEKVKGSFSDLSIRSSQEDILSRSSSDVADCRKRISEPIADHYSSQSSLRSADSTHSAQDGKANTLNDHVRHRPIGKRSLKKADRPLSVPYGGESSSGRLGSLTASQPSIPAAGTDSTSELNVTSSTTSLNKATYDVEVVISSCSKCHKCNCLVYDEEIMAGWLGDDSNLNSRCPFCNAKFVPFLNIEITDYRNLEHKDPSSSINKAFAGSFTLAVDSSQTISSHSEASTNLNNSTRLSAGSPVQSKAADTEGKLLPPTVLHPAETASPSTIEVAFSAPNSFSAAPSRLSPTMTSSSLTHPDTSATNSPQEQKPPAYGSLNSEARVRTEFSTSYDTTPSVNLPNVTIQDEATQPPPTPRGLEPVTVPYLSSLVLRKELESLLENEGTNVLTEPYFVDHHPILFWNLVWYFKRLNLRSNLFDLISGSQLLKADFDGQSQGSKCHVMIYLMWDNYKLHANEHKPPLYLAWLASKWMSEQRYVWTLSDYALLCLVAAEMHSASGTGNSEAVDSASSGEEDFAYSHSFLDTIIENIKENDVRGPLVAVLNELNVQRGGLRRSAYREILYLIIVALKKVSIDIDAFDREYKRAYDALTMDELKLAHKCDSPPKLHAVEARQLFGVLDLVK